MHTLNISQLYIHTRLWLIEIVITSISFLLVRENNKVISTAIYINHTKRYLQIFEISCQNF
jgi:hypothetical protein